MEAAAAVIRERGGQAAGDVLDVTDGVSVEAFVERVMTDFGRIDSLMDCAGINARQPAEDYPEEAWVHVLNTNLTGAYRTCQAVGRRMIQQERENP